MALSDGTIAFGKWGTSTSPGSERLEEQVSSGPLETALCEKGACLKEKIKTRCC